MAGGWRLAVMEALLFGAFATAGLVASDGDSVALAWAAVAWAIPNVALVTAQVADRLHLRQFVAGLRDAGLAVDDVAVEQGFFRVRHVSFRTPLGPGRVKAVRRGVRFWPPGASGPPATLAAHGPGLPGVWRLQHRELGRLQAQAILRHRAAEPPMSRRRRSRCRLEPSKKGGEGGG